eukprot:4120909-Pleurochrysis_carterae.AAC.5
MSVRASSYVSTCPKVLAPLARSVVAYAKRESVSLRATLSRARLRRPCEISAHLTSTHSHPVACST